MLFSSSRTIARVGIGGGDGAGRVCLEIGGCGGSSRDQNACNRLILKAVVDIINDVLFISIFISISISIMDPR